MRVMLIDPSLYAPQYNDPLAAALAELHHVTVVGRPERADQVPSAFPVDGHFYRLAERVRRRHATAGQVVKSFEHATDLLRLGRRVRRERVDIVHLQWSVVPLMDMVAIRRLRRRAPVVFTVHDTTTMHGSANFVQGSGMAGVLRAADALVVHTDHSRSVLLDQGIDPARVTVVPHGPIGRTGATPVRAPGPIRLLEYGKIRPYKGIDVLIEALARLSAAEQAELRVTVAGEPLIDMAPLQRLAVERGVDHLIAWELGYVSDERTTELLAEHDVMVLPYTDIDSSGVLALAQTWPMPVVASEVGGFAEQLAGSTSALLFPNRDAGALADRFRELTRSGRLDELGQGARAELDRIPSWDEAAKLTSELYARLLAGRSR